jgi:MYXO-CTERM domain-containing protein
MSTNRLSWTGRIVFTLLLSAVAMPTSAQSPADQGQPVTVDRDDDGFDDWGLLGLLGLAGLLGRRRNRDMVETRRV